MKNLFNNKDYKALNEIKGCNVSSSPNEELENGGNSSKSLTSTYHSLYALIKVIERFSLYRVAYSHTPLSGVSSKIEFIDKYRWVNNGRTHKYEDRCR